MHILKKGYYLKFRCAPDIFVRVVAKKSIAITNELK